MKTGLVLEGGAVRAMYSAGVCDGFLKMGITFDYVNGESAGITYGASYLSGQFGRNLEISEKYINDPRYMGVRDFLNPRNRSYFGLDFIYDEIPNRLVPFDYQVYQSYPGEVEVGVTDVESGKAVYLEPDRTDRKWMLYRATCAMPLMFPIIECMGVKCLDGGCSDSIPWKRALEKGCDRVVVVLTHERDFRRGAEKSMPLIRLRYREYPNFLKTMETRAERYNRQKEELFEAVREGKAKIFYPSSTKGFSRTERDVEKIRSFYRYGMDQCLERERELKSFLELA